MIIIIDRIKYFVCKYKHDKSFTGPAKTSSKK